jgi:hypothetical protein
VLARVSGVARVVRAGAGDRQSRREQLVALTWAMRASVGRREAVVQRQGRARLRGELSRLVRQELEAEQRVRDAQSALLFGQVERLSGERELLVRGRLLARVVRLRLSILEALLA